MGTESSKNLPAEKPVLTVQKRFEIEQHVEILIQKYGLPPNFLCARFIMTRLMNNVDIRMVWISEMAQCDFCKWINCVSNADTQTKMLEWIKHCGRNVKQEIKHQDLNVRIPGEKTITIKIIPFKSITARDIADAIMQEHCVHIDHFIFNGTHKFQESDVFHVWADIHNFDITRDRLCIVTWQNQ